MYKENLKYIIILGSFYLEFLDNSVTEKTSMIKLDYIEIVMASMLLTILLMVTQKKWAWWYKLIFIFIWACLSWYLFSWVPWYIAPEIYESSLRTALNGCTTIISFMLLIYIFERDLLNEAFSTVKIKYFDNKKKWQD